jgi:non-specific serine/threonine protein kinase
VLLAVGQFTSPQVRLLNLIGPGGVGKTSVALVVADRLHDDLVTDVHLAELAEAAGPEEVWRALAKVLGLDEGDDGTDSGPGPIASEQVVRALHGKQLLVLDGCEHVLECVAAMVADLLAGCGELRILATSRTPLRVREEYLLPIAPLQTPDRIRGVSPAELMQVSSISLFVQRLRALSPSFVLTPENAESVAEICRLLDGLPMGIEIAADLARQLGVFRLRVRLRAGKNVSREGYLTASARHRSLWAITEWSHRLLDLDDQARLEQLAVCADGFDSHLAEAVWNVPPEVAERTLGKLIDGQLVMLQEQAHSEPQFKLLKTVRSFCAQRLAERRDEAEVRRRHAEYIAAMVEAPCEGPQQVEQLSGLLRNEENIHTALEHFVEQHEFEVGLDLVLEVAGLWPLCRDIDRAVQNMRRIVEGVEVLLDSGRCDDPGALREQLADATVLLARVLVGRDRPDRVVAFCERAVRLQLDERGQAAASGELGRGVLALGDRDRAYELLEKSISALDGMGAMHEAVFPTLALAEMWRSDQRLAEASDLLATAFRAVERRGDVHGTALVQAVTALVAAELDDIARADLSHRESLRLFADLGDRRGLSTGLDAYGRFLWKATGQAHRAIRLFAAADCHREAAGLPHAPASPETEEVCEHVRGELGTAVFETAWAEGRRFGGSAVIVEALHAPPIGPGSAVRDALSDRLTARQFQVAMLIARGLTNRQISRQLDISEWTVVNHVRQVMRKLDVPSRVHVAQLIARRG